MPNDGVRARSLRLPRRRPTAADAWQAIIADRDPDPPAWRRGWGMGLGVGDVMRSMHLILALRPSDLERLRSALTPHLHPGDMHALAWLLWPHRPDWPADAADAPPAADPMPEAEAADAVKRLPSALRSDLMADADTPRRKGALVRSMRAGLPESAAVSLASGPWGMSPAEAASLVAWAARAAAGGGRHAG